MRWYETLVAGETYFLVGFVDNDLTVPSMDTFIYVGLGVRGADSEGKHCFQDAHSFLGEPGEQSETTYIAIGEESLDMVADKPGLIRWLQSKHSTSVDPLGA